MPGTIRSPKNGRVSSSGLAEVTRRVAAFDFDGTLARGDAVLPFFIAVAGRRRLARALLTQRPLIAKVVVGKESRDVLKERVIAEVLAGRRASEVEAIGVHFAERLVAERLRPAVLERLQWHRQRGHEVVIVSASLDSYLRPLSDTLGVDALLCTRLEIAGELVTGRLVGANVRADEKVRLLRQHCGNGAIELWAYGNSSGDHAMLAAADHPTWVSRRGRLSPWHRPAA